MTLRNRPTKNLCKFTFQYKQQSKKSRGSRRWRLQPRPCKCGLCLQPRHLLYSL